MGTMAITLFMSISLWRKLSNGDDRILYHNRFLDMSFLSITLAIIIVGGFVCGFARPDSPIIFPYAQEYPSAIVDDSANTQML
jgi:hypothetical protein